MKRTWTGEEKEAILRDVEKPGIVIGCRKHGIYATTYFAWKKKYDEAGIEKTREWTHEDIALPLIFRKMELI
ncbi:MAG TPA: transposase [Bacteroidia bacterium]|nr:transposase [Bacteroidia bacterium]HRS58357.1 transposase [Bacteroidia bacterium]